MITAIKSASSQTYSARLNQPSPTFKALRTRGSIPLDTISDGEPLQDILERRLDLRLHKKNPQPKGTLGQLLSTLMNRVSTSRTKL